MARGGRVLDGRALSPSSAIPGARLMPAMRLAAVATEVDALRQSTDSCRWWGRPQWVGVKPTQPRDRPQTP